MLRIKFIKNDQASWEASKNMGTQIRNVNKKWNTNKSSNHRDTKITLLKEYWECITKF